MEFSPFLLWGVFFFFFSKFRTNHHNPRIWDFLLYIEIFKIERERESHKYIIYDPSIHHDSMVQIEKDSQTRIHIN